MVKGAEENTSVDTWSVIIALYLKLTSTKICMGTFQTSHVGVKIHKMNINEFYLQCKNDQIQWFIYSHRIF